MKKTPRMLREAITEAETALEVARVQYLNGTGWKQVCDFPGGYWLWEKALPDGRVVALNIKMACAMQDNWPR